MKAWPWSAGTAPPRYKVPQGAVDSHHHIYDARFPTDPRADLKPEDATVAQYRQLQARLGMRRSVVVQPSSYGSDNRCLLDALAQLGQNARGIAVVDKDVSDEELRTLDLAGVRGVRFNLARPAGPSTQDIEALARRIAPLGWHVQLHALGSAYPPLEPVLARLPVPVVIDHLGRLPPGGALQHPAWAVLRRLVDGGNTWIKLSGAYHDSRDGAPDYRDAGRLARAWLEVAPERMLWGTDWPHVSAMAGEKPMPDDARLLDLFAEWTGSSAFTERVLVTNPQTLYGFGPAGRPSEPADDGGSLAPPLQRPPSAA